MTFYDAVDPTGIAYYQDWIRHFPALYTQLTTTVHANHANRELRNKFRSRFGIDCVFFRPDESCSSYVDAAADLWLAVTEWGVARQVAHGRTFAVKDLKWCAIATEAFEPDSLGYRAILHPALSPRPHLRQELVRQPGARSSPGLPRDNQSGCHHGVLIWPPPLRCPTTLASLAAFLLGDYLAQLGDPRFTEEERFERRMKLEYQLWKLEDLAPMAAYRMVGVISQTFAGDLDRRLIPAIEWYFDFLSAKNEQWLNEVSRTQLIRIWKAMPTRRLRDRALETLLWIEATIHPDQPEKSEIVRLFRDEELIAGDGELTPQGVEIAEILLREAVTSPRYPPDFPIIL